MIFFKLKTSIFLFLYLKYQKLNVWINWRWDFAQQSLQSECVPDFYTQSDIQRVTHFTQQPTENRHILAPRSIRSVYFDLIFIWTINYNKRGNLTVPKKYVGLYATEAGAKIFFSELEGVEISQA